MIEATREPLVRPVGLKTNDDSDLVACAFARPTLSWRLEGTASGGQLAYELQRSADGAFAVSCSSGRLESGAVVGALWIGADLASREVAWLRVRVWTSLGVTEWSEPLRIEGALFEAGDWLAQPISPDFNCGQAETRPVPLLRKSFVVSGPVSQARLYLTALGIQQCWLNGAPITHDLFEPGWTAYAHRLLYATYDVTGLLRAGENVLAAAVGDGWWRGNLTWMGRRAVYGDTTALLAQLELIAADGSHSMIATDSTWRGGMGAIRSADIYDGCVVDLAEEPTKWREARFDDRHWAAVVPLPRIARLEQRSMPAVREVTTIDPTITRRPSGAWAIDCGQNLTGYLELDIAADSPGSVEVRHAEVLEADGELHTAALRTARAIDTYRVLPGNSQVKPAFTYHGFRHAEVTCDDGLRLDNAKVRVVSSDLREIGHFACSDELVNRLYSNIKWSQRGNFFAIPTDCPQRDERLGWTGDIQVFAETACANFDARAFLASWLVDLAHEQAADGNVPSTVPNVIPGHEFEYGGVGWGDAATLVPWVLYEAYGDREFLARQFPSMRAWVDYGLSRLAGDGTWSGDFHLGDWLDPGAPPDKPEQATTDRDFIASAYLVKSLRVLAQSARSLGESGLSEHYQALGAGLAAATWAKWSNAAVTTQTGCAMAIEFGIAPVEDLQRLGACLADQVTRADGRIATGFLGTPLVLPALTRTGQNDAAYRLLLNEQAPGWLDQVINGATTVWERWDAIKPGGIIHGGEMAAEDAASMTSFNHYAYGAVGAWLYRSLAGIAPAEPGYRVIAFAPQPGGGLEWAEASIDTPYGLGAIRWERRADALEVRIEVPPGAAGKFASPRGWGEGPDELASGIHEFSLRSGAAPPLARDG
ncbi:MAG: family 78 glycoside hydrolase catalytic domain [Novosphingobium sp.]